MLKKVFFALLPLSLIFSEEQNDQKPNKDENTDIPEIAEIQLEPKKQITADRYSMMYFQAESFVFLRHIKYEYFVPSVGMGYRTHKKQHGLDISINAFPFPGEYGYWFPFLKTFYLHYPNYAKNNFFYYGIGVIVLPIPIPIPLATVGIESDPAKAAKFFAQIEFTYGCAALNLGVGF